MRVMKVRVWGSAETMNKCARSPRRFAGQRRQRDNGFLSHANEMDVGLRYADVHFHGIQFHDFKGGLSGACHLAGLNGALRNKAGYRRAERRVRQAFPGQLFRGGGLLQVLAADT
jgi:hypothetical protein